MNGTCTSRRGTWTVSGIAVSLALFCGAATTAHANIIGPGFDFFTTPPGGALVDLGLGPIPLMGIPLPNMALGADTIVSRMDPGPPEGGAGLIDIELVALHLQSVAPVDIDGPGGPAPIGDLHITIDAGDRFFSNAPFTPFPDGTGVGPSPFGLPTLPTPPSTGNMDMQHGGPGPHTGAIMRAVLGDPGDAAGFGAPFTGLGVPGGGIYASAFLVIPGGDLFNPLDVLFSTPAPRVALGSIGTYIHTADTPDQRGGIMLVAIQHVGPHPNAQPVADHVLPEPSAGFVLMIGGLGLLARRRRRAA